MDVSEALSQFNQKYKSAEVARSGEIDLDVGNLLAYDAAPLDFARGEDALSVQLADRSRECVQVLFNAIWELPTQRSEVGIIATLPRPTTALPREKPVPAIRAETKWEKFAKEKGIVKRKRERMVWDETHKEYRPRFGYKRVDDEKKNWILPVPQSANPYEDQFAKQQEARKERVEANTKRQLRNLTSAGVLKPEELIAGNAATKRAVKKERLVKEISVSKTATASYGRFDKAIAAEPKIKAAGKRRQFTAVATKDGSAEKDKQLGILGKLERGESVLDVKKAVGQHIQRKQGTPGGVGGGKAGATKAGKAGKSSGGSGGGGGGTQKQGKKRRSKKQ